MSESSEATPTKQQSDDSAVGEEMLEAIETPPVSHSHSMLLKHVQVPYWDVSNPLHQTNLDSLPDICIGPRAHPACSLATQWYFRNHMLHTVYIHYSIHSTLEQKMRCMVGAVLHGLKINVSISGLPTLAAL